MLQKVQEIAMNVLVGIVAGLVMALITQECANHGTSDIVALAMSLPWGWLFMFFAGRTNPADWWHTPTVPTIAATVYMGIFVSFPVVDGNFHEALGFVGSPTMLKIYLACGTCWIAAYAAKQFRARQNRQRVAKMVGPGIV